MRFFILIIAFLGLSLSSRAAIDMSRANEAYSKGKFDEALSLYRQLSEQGNISWALYYNLANAAFKTGNYAEAVLNYEKAVRLNPNNPDILYNLKVTQSQLPDKQTVLTYAGLTGFLLSVRNLMHIDYWAWLSILFFMLSFISFLLAYLVHSLMLKKAMLIGVVIWVLPALFSVGQAQWYYVDWHKKEAVVMNTEATVYSSPDKSVALFLLHYGSKVSILKEKQGWLNVSYEDKSGWIEENLISRISIP